jgi:hypothetical protein
MVSSSHWTVARSMLPVTDLRAQLKSDMARDKSYIDP